MVTSIHVEVRPRLRSANVLAITDAPADKVAVDEDSLSVDDRRYRLPAKTFVPGTVSSLQKCDSYVAFHVQVCAPVSGVGCEVLPPVRLVPPHRPAPAAPVDAGLAYSVHCGGCGAAAGQVTPDRVLPLPSTLWLHESQDWFCCCAGGGDGGGGARLTSKEGDFLYSPLTIVVSASSFPDALITNTEAVCKGCGRQLGFRQGPSVTLWRHTLRLTQSNTQISWVDSPQAAFRRCVTGVAEESATLMPKLVMNTVDNKKLFLWIVEKELLVYQVEPGQSDLAKKSFLKVLYSETSETKAKGGEDFLKEEVQVLTEVFESGVSLLKLSTKGFPESFARANGFDVGYIEKL